ncbi:MAG: hypothetical protein HeimC3_44200 [Candidatus Heimdallarchaeota archaeon LC_3]|nr:MAG: hypothetical protein HeimC3_44200 [Candidatus Heimdallarchaeota archaeon LC_3]
MNNHPNKKFKFKIFTENEKTITIRGIDKDLYERYMALTKVFAHSTGFMFSRLINHYKKDRTPELRHIRHMKSENEPTLELIKDLDKLKITKNDLMDAGEKIKYFFKNINHLEFASDVDNKVLEKHVYQIRNCKVNMPENISKLLMYSIIRSPKPISYTPDTTGSITIRKVQAEVYDEFLSACQLHNEKVGDAVNYLLTQVIPQVEITVIIMHELRENPLHFLTITTLDSLKVTKEDMEVIQERKLLFHRISNLEFAEDISSELFVEKVAGIYKCDNVSLPETVPRLIKLSRIKNEVEMIEKS